MADTKLLAFYGDDFTGSTDALEFLCRAGIKTALFLEPPTPQQLSKFDGLQAIGVAGATRAMSPEQMEATLQPAFEALKQLGVRHVHYKVCSTFDSSPHIGSIGCAIDTGATVFNKPFVPVLVAAPALGRYSLFGNLFARMGIGSQGQIYRLDRHPSMSKHPVTPADEADLRLHLSRQTNKKMGLVDVLALAKPLDEARIALQQEIDKGAEVVFFDGLDEAHLQRAGELMDEMASTREPLFSVGSSGVEMALGSTWQSTGNVVPITWPNAQAVATLLVISGSCSPVTSQQIATAEAAGFVSIGIDTTALAEGVNSDKLIESYVADASAAINKGQSVIIHTSEGNDDSRVAAAHKVFSSQGLDEQAIRGQTSKVYGTALGQIADGVLQQTNLQRLVIAGGDTSSYAARALGIEAVEMIAAVTPGAPLCRAYAEGRAVDGKEVNIKGGQVGAPDYFLTVLNGKTL